MACVSNLGTFANWTGHVLAQSNTFGFGKLAWDPTRSAESINAEWTKMTFPSRRADDAEAVRRVVERILARGRRVYEGHTSPLGIGFIVFGGCPGTWNTQNSGWCASPTQGPGPGPYGMECPTSPGLGDLHGGLDHYWVDPCSNYGFSNYSHDGLGCDRSAATGTGYASQYSRDVARLFEDVETTPQDLLLWFHNLPWTHPMPKPSDYAPAPGEPDVPGDAVSLYSFIRHAHYSAVDEAKNLSASWDTLEGKVDDARWTGVQARFAQQVNDAAVMRDHIMGQYAAWYEHDHA